MASTPDPEFEVQFAHFAARLAGPLLSALRNAYDEACAQHGSYDGGNESTFGTNVYNFAIHEVNLAGENDPFVKVTSRAPLFRFTAGAYELCCHKVGQSETDDIDTHFPNGKGATTMVASLMLPGFEEVGPDLKKVRCLVVAHMGNHEDGLCAVYLCVGKSADEQHIREWAYTHCLWKRDAGGALPVESGGNAPPNLPPEETVEETEPRRKPRKGEREGEG